MIDIVNSTYYKWNNNQKKNTIGSHIRLPPSSNTYQIDNNNYFSKLLIKIEIILILIKNTINH